MSTVQTDYVAPPVAQPLMGQILDGDGHMYMDVPALKEIAGKLDPGHMATFLSNYIGTDTYNADVARNQRLGLPTDYASLKMPDETRYYVPKLQAVKNIIANPAAYGVKLPEIPDHPYFVTVTTSRDIDVALAAKLANMPLDEFKALNPSFNRPVILGAANPQILLPFDNAERFQYNLNTYRGGLSSWTALTVDSRERVEALAARLNVDADTLREINRIPATKTLVVKKAAAKIGRAHV